MRWEAGRARIHTDRGRLAQALGNLVANAAEHGSGPVELQGRREGRGIEIEVRNRPRPDGQHAAGGGRPAAPGGGERGRGLAIASAAAREAGGTLRVRRDEEEVVASLELPDGGLPPAA